MKKRKVYVLIGLPGSGKSTWATARLYFENEKTCAIVSRDAILTMLCGEYKYYEGFKDIVTEIGGSASIQILNNGYDLIVDQTNLTVEIRQEVTNFIVRLFPRRNDVEIWFVHFTETETNLARRMKDSRGETIEYYFDIIQKMKNKFEPIRFSEDYNYLLEVDGCGRESLEQNFKTGLKCDSCTQFKYHVAARNGPFSYHFCQIGLWKNDNINLSEESWEDCDYYKQNQMRPL